MPDLFIANPKKAKNVKKTPVSKTQVLETFPEKKRIRALAAYTEFPENLAFENQELDEKIYLFLRKHLNTNLRWVTISVIGILIPLILLLILPFLEAANLTLPSNYIFILLFFYYLILTGYAFINFITWYYNVGIITNMRVVDIDIAYITNKSVAATGLADIVDVEYSQSGFLQNLFDYGNVHMQTEGLKANFEFLEIPKPAKTTDIISDLMREAKNE